MRPKRARLEMYIKTRRDDKVHNVAAVCSNVTMHSACNASDGRVEFDMLDTPQVNCRFGDPIILTLDGKVIFQGKLFTISRSSDVYQRHYVFFDESYYLRNSITYPVPAETRMIDLVTGLLNKYEIKYTRLDDAGEMVSERKIANTSILDAINGISEYVSYMYDKMYVIRTNCGLVEYIDIESTNINGFTDSYPLVIKFSNSESISSQTYNYFEFYKLDDKKEKTKKDPKSGKPAKKGVSADNVDGLGQQDTFAMQAKGGTLPKWGNGTSSDGGGSTEVKYLKPLVPYEQQKINLEIALYAVGGVNSARAKSEMEGKPEIVEDIDQEKKGYDIGSKGYKLTGEVQLWGYLPMIKEVKDFPPEDVINHIINIRRNPVRKASFTVLVHKELHLAGDKLFIGENENLASVYVINSVTTKFTDEGVIQELDIFSWQKTYDIQRLILAESVKKMEQAGGIGTVQAATAFDIKDVITAPSKTTPQIDSTKLEMSKDVYNDEGVICELGKNPVDVNESSHEILICK